MAKFYHIQLAPLFTDNSFSSIDFCYGDTDSILYCVELRKNNAGIDSHYELLRNIVEDLDTNNLDPSHPFFTYKTSDDERIELLCWRSKNAKKIGKWKFENGNYFIEEYNIKSCLIV